MVVFLAHFGVDRPFLHPSFQNSNCSPLDPWIPERWSLSVAGQLGLQPEGMGAGPPRCNQSQMPTFGRLGPRLQRQH